MQITIGEAIRRLRHRDNRTQEALASAIGVTSQAVSRWESNGGYPDIELVPIIANYFHVTIDELFGYDNQREAKIQSILDEADKQILSGSHLDQYITVLQGAAEEFPSDVRIQIRLGTAFVVLGFNGHGALSSKPTRDGDGENIITHNRENADFVSALAVFERILPEITDPNDRATVIRQMVRLYSIRGEYDKAEALAQKQPPLAVSRECLLPATAIGEEKNVFQGELLLELASQMSKSIIRAITCRYALRASHIGIEKALSMIQLYKAIIDDGNYGYVHYELQELYRLCARTATELHLYDEAKEYARCWFNHHTAYKHLKDEGGEFRYSATMVAGVSVKISTLPPISPWYETIARQSDELKALVLGDNYFN